MNDEPVLRRDIDLKSMLQTYVQSDNANLQESLQMRSCPCQRLEEGQLLSHGKSLCSSSKVPDQHDPAVFRDPKNRRGEEKVNFSYPVDSHELSNYFDERIAVYYENFSEPYQDNHKVHLNSSS